MFTFHTLSYRLAQILLPLSIALTAYLYLYPLAHQCAFPSPPAGAQRWLEKCEFGDDEVLNGYYRRRDVAPFRLLALGDPQLEGDTSLPPEVVRRFPGFGHVRQELLGGQLKSAGQNLVLGAEDVKQEGLRFLKYLRKEMDLLGNDFYLAHIYRTMHWWTQPTHVTVLGDLLGSQWINDEEFQDRADRFWGRVFRGAEAVPKGVLVDYKNEDEQAAVELLGGEYAWNKRLINVVGNHDIGYAGDINKQRVERFEKAFGGVNGDLRFALPMDRCGGEPGATVPALRLVLLNSMNIDGPVHDEDLQQDTFKFINSVIQNSDAVGTNLTSTILLTHIPLHKEPGVCVDEPFFSYFSSGEGGGVKEQNMLSKPSSAQAVLEGLLGMHPYTEKAVAGGVGRDAVILTGHDHEGCDVYHYADKEQKKWTAQKYGSEEAFKARGDASTPGLREVTVRSMMGEFGGYAGLVSAWWDEEKGKWNVEVSMCSLGVQHIWWAVHIIDLVTIAVCFLSFITRGAPAPNRTPPKSPRGKVAFNERVDEFPTVNKERVNTPHIKKERQSDSPGSVTSTARKKKSSGSAFSRRFEQNLDEDRDSAEGYTPKPKRKKAGAKVKKES